MTLKTKEELAATKCAPCEGGMAAHSTQQAEAQLTQLSGWSMTHDGKRIRKDWTMPDFLSSLGFFQKVAAIAEEDGHHPDLHLEGYRNVWIELWTHAIGGLSDNDFILAAKIDHIPLPSSQ